MKKHPMPTDSLPADRGRSPTYDVGYSRPPVETRFRKGSSGNPRGRPKGSKSAKALLELALSAPVTITEGGMPKVIEQRTALFKALVAKAIKGDTRSAALVIKLMDQFGMSVPAHVPITTIVRQIVVSCTQTNACGRCRVSSSFWAQRRPTTKTHTV